MKIIAHRGASAVAPENTLAAICMAWVQGADGVEVDVRLSADGVPVVVHDESIRKPDGNPGRVGDLSLDLLRAYSLSDKEKFQWEVIPTFAEAMGIVPQDKIFLVELKEGPVSFFALEKVVTVNNINVDNWLFMSFFPKTLMAVRSIHPDWRCLLLVPEARECCGRSFEDFVDEALKNKFDGLGIARDWLNYPEEVKKVVKTGLVLSVWTVNDPAEMPDWIELGASFVTSDCPDKLRRQAE